MSKGIFLLLLTWLFFKLPGLAVAQPSDWQVPDPSQFNYSATVVANVLLDDSWESDPANALAFFADGEISGLGIPVQTSSGLVYYTTVYSNAPVQDLNVLFYHGGSDQVLNGFGHIQFELYSSTGSTENPITFRAYLDNDAPVKIAGIPPQQTLQGFPFSEIDLGEFLLSIDGDPVEWSAEANSNLTVSINGSLLLLTPDPGFSGETNLWVAVTELTDNQKSDTVQVNLSVAESYSGPLFDVVPGQGVVKGNGFRNLCDEEGTVLRDLREFEIQSDSCLTFDYLPVIGQNPNPETVPDWVFSGFFPNSMTILAEAYYSPNYRFMGENDLLAAFIEGELRGVTGPVYNGGRWIFYLNIAGQARDGEVVLKYYSGELERILTLPENIDFKPYEILGAWNQPQTLDFIPLLPEIDEYGQLEIIVKDYGWTGTQEFYFYAQDCLFPEFLFDSTVVSYCVVEDSTDLTFYYLIGEERGFSAETRFTRSCSPPEGYVGILPFNCSYDVVIDVQNACSMPIPDLRLELDDLEHCDATEWSGVQQVPAPFSNLIQVADTIIVFMYKANDSGTNDLCNFQLILENFGEEVSLDCPELIAVDAIGGDCEAYVDLTVGYTQGCGPAIVTNDYTSNGANASEWYPLDTTNVAFDLWENDEISDSCVVMIVVRDVQIPVIDCPGNMLIEVDSGSCVATAVDLGVAEFWMACGTAEISNNAPADYEIGETEVIWSAVGYNGFSSQCSQLVMVEDHQPPVIICPEDISLEIDPGGCEVSGYEPVGLSSTAVCGDVTLEYEVPATLNHGPNQIQYTAIASNGTESVCSQLVTVVGAGDFTIDCPANLDIVLDEGICEIWNLDPGTAIVEGNCVPLVVSSNVPEVIYEGVTQVVHTAEAPDGTAVDCIQEIVVSDIQSPLINCPADTIISTDPAVCFAIDQGFGNAVAYMACGSVSLENNAPSVFSLGVTEVTYTATGYNGQVSECTREVMVIDDEAPELNCPEDVSLLIPFGHTDAFVQIESGEAFDNCGIDSIYNSFNEGGANASGIYPLGITEVVFTAVDLASNIAECEMSVIITEAEQELDTFYIDGQIATWTGHPVAGVEMSVQGGSTNEFTNSSGNYLLQVFENQSAIVTPKKNEDWLNGVSTLDLVLIQGHVIGLNPLTGPYAIIAGDANKDGQVSTFDLVLLQNLIIGQIEEIPGNKAWRFIPGDYIFDDPQNPFDESFPEIKVYPYINQDFTDENWIAVKTGDASGDAAQNGSRGLRGHRSFNVIAEEDENGMVTVRFFLPTEEFISGYQLEIFADPGEMELISYSINNSVLPNLTDNNFFLHKEEGLLRTNWWYAPGRKPEREELVFEVVVKPFRDGIDVSSHIRAGGPFPRFNSEIYSRNGEVSSAGISWKFNEARGDFSLFQNEPNPFNTQTIIPFKLPEAGRIFLNIYDSGGLLLQKTILDGQKGMNYYKFTADENYKGLLYYQLISGDRAGVKKMIVH